jgi:hypothetical protein
VGSGRFGRRRDVEGCVEGEVVGGVERLELLGRLRIRAAVGVQSPGLSPVGTRQLGHVSVVGDAQQVAGTTERARAAPGLLVP